MMSSAYSRKKQPEQVRKALLDCAVDIMARQGLAHLTVQGVAAAAGVTKGGLFHHFPNKQALVDAVVAHLMAKLDEDVDVLMARDPVAHGRFTRAYINVTFDEANQAPGSPWMVMSLAVMAEMTLVGAWSEWIAGRLDRHADTDKTPALEIARMAADGAWLASMTKTEAVLVADMSGLRDRLIAMTRDA